MNELNTALALIAHASQTKQLTSSQEDALIDLVLRQDATLLLLARHFPSASFIRHALRNLSFLTALSSPSSLPLTAAAISTSASPVPVPVTVPDPVPDLVVVGSGLAGLTAALSVYERGGSVVILEKEGFMGGNSGKASSGINAVVPTSASQTGDSVERFTEDVINGGRHTTAWAKELAAMLVESSGEAFDWLRASTGLGLDKVSQLGGHSVARTFRPSDGLAGAEMIRTLSKVANSHAAANPDRFRIMKKTTVSGLLFEPADANTIQGVESRVTGVRTASGTEVSGRAVLLATGGFGSDTSSNSSLIQRFAPQLAGYPTTNGRWSTGDGHKLAETVGAGLVDMANVQVHPTGFIDPKRPTSPVKTLAAELLRGVGGVLLTQRGERFVNELGTRAHVTGRMLEEAAASNDAERSFFLLLGDKAAKVADKHVPLYLAKGLLVQYDTLRAAAKAMGVSLTRLSASLTEYNRVAAAAAAGKDAFDKTFFHNTPLPAAASDGPVYVGVVTPVVHYTMGGVRVDTDARVLRETGDVVPGLYAAGEVVGGVHGMNRLAGNALTEAVVFGRIVGARLPLGAAAVVEASRGSGGDSEGAGADAGDSSSSDTALRSITQQELEAHNTVGESVWMAIHGLVYDLTDFVEEHPGGAESIEDNAGKDATTSFATVHTEAMLEDFDPIGRLADSEAE